MLFGFLEDSFYFCFLTIGEINDSKLAEAIVTKSREHITDLEVLRVEPPAQVGRHV